jgi:hypothetical protein
MPTFAQNGEEVVQTVSSALLTDVSVLETEKTLNAMRTGRAFVSKAAGTAMYTERG